MEIPITSTRHEKLFLILIIACVSASAQPNWLGRALLQQPVASSGGGSPLYTLVQYALANSCPVYGAVTFTNNVAAGDVIVVVGFEMGTGNILSSTSDAGGNAYTCTNFVNSTGGGCVEVLGVAVATTGGFKTVYAGPADYFTQAAAIEYRGATALNAKAGASGSSFNITSTAQSFFISAYVQNSATDGTKTHTLNGVSGNLIMSGTTCDGGLVDICDFENAGAGYPATTYTINRPDIYSTSCFIGVALH